MVLKGNDIGNKILTGISIGDDIDNVIDNNKGN